MMKKTLTIAFITLAIAACKKEYTPPPPPIEKSEWGMPFIDYVQIRAAYPITADSPNNFAASYALAEILVKTGNDISMYNKGYYQYSNDTANERLSYLYYLNKNIKADSIIFNRGGIMRFTTDSLRKQTFMLDSNSFKSRKSEVKEKPLMLDFHYGSTTDYSEPAKVIQALNKILITTQGRYYIPHY